MVEMFLIMSSIATYNPRLCVSIPSPSPHPQLATRVQWLPASKWQPPWGPNYSCRCATLLRFSAVYISPRMKMPVIKILLCISSLSHPPCEASAGSCWSWQSAAVSHGEQGWFEWCLCLMRSVSWEEHTIKAEGKLVGRRWKSDGVSSQPKTADELQHQQSVPPPFPVIAVSLSEPLLWWC